MTDLVTEMRIVGLRKENARAWAEVERLRSALDGIAGRAIDFKDAKARAEKALAPNGAIMVVADRRLG